MGLVAPHVARVGVDALGGHEVAGRLGELVAVRVVPADELVAQGARGGHGLGGAAHSVHREGGVAHHAAGSGHVDHVVLVPDHGGVGDGGDFLDPLGIERAAQGLHELSHVGVGGAGVGGHVDPIVGAGHVGEGQRVVDLGHGLAAAQHRVPAVEGVAGLHGNNGRGGLARRHGRNQVGVVPGHAVLVGHGGAAVGVVVQHEGQLGPDGVDVHATQGAQDLQFVAARIVGLAVAVDVPAGELVALAHERVGGRQRDDGAHVGGERRLRALVVDLEIAHLGVGGHGGDAGVPGAAVGTHVHRLRRGDPHGFQCHGAQHGELGGVQQVGLGRLEVARVGVVGPGGVLPGGGAVEVLEVPAGEDEAHLRLRFTVVLRVGRHGVEVVGALGAARSHAAEGGHGVVDVHTHEVGVALVFLPVAAAAVVVHHGEAVGAVEVGQELHVASDGDLAHVLGDTRLGAAVVVGDRVGPVREGRVGGLVGGLAPDVGVLEARLRQEGAGRGRCVLLDDGRGAGAHGVGGIAGIQAEGHVVGGAAGPDGVQGHVLAVLACVVDHGLVHQGEIRVRIARALDDARLLVAHLERPASKGVAIAREVRSAVQLVVAGQRIAHAIGEGLRVHGAHGVVGTLVEVHSVGRGHPLGVEIVVLAGDVAKELAADQLAVVVVVTLAVCLGVPADEGVALAGDERGAHAAQAQGLSVDLGLSLGGFAIGLGGARGHHVDNLVGRGAKDGGHAKLGGPELVVFGVGGLPILKHLGGELGLGIDDAARLGIDPVLEVVAGLGHGGDRREALGVAVEGHRGSRTRGARALGHLAAGAGTVGKGGGVHLPLGGQRDRHVVCLAGEHVVHSVAGGQAAHDVFVGLPADEGVALAVDGPLVAGHGGREGGAVGPLGVGHLVDDASVTAATVDDGVHVGCEMGREGHGLPHAGQGRAPDAAARGLEGLGGHGGAADRGVDLAGVHVGGAVIGPAVEVVAGGGLGDGARGLGVVVGLDVLGHGDAGVGVGAALLVGAHGTVSAPVLGNVGQGNLAHGPVGVQDDLHGGIGRIGHRAQHGLGGDEPAVGVAGNEGLPLAEVRAAVGCGIPAAQLPALARDVLGVHGGQVLILIAHVGARSGRVGGAVGVVDQGEAAQGLPLGVEGDVHGVGVGRDVVVAQAEDALDGIDGVGRQHVLHGDVVIGARLELAGVVDPTHQAVARAAELDEARGVPGVGRAGRGVRVGVVLQVVICLGAVPQGDVVTQFAREGGMAIGCGRVVNRLCHVAHTRALLGVGAAQNATVHVEGHVDHDVAVPLGCEDDSIHARALGAVARSIASAVGGVHIARSVLGARVLHAVGVDPAGVVGPVVQDVAALGVVLVLLQAVGLLLLQLVGVVSRCAARQVEALALGQEELKNGALDVAAVTLEFHDGTRRPGPGNLAVQVGEGPGTGVAVDIGQLLAGQVGAHGNLVAVACACAGGAGHRGGHPAACLVLGFGDRGQDGLEHGVVVHVEGSNAGGQVHIAVFPVPGTRTMEEIGGEVVLVVVVGPDAVVVAYTVGLVDLPAAQVHIGQLGQEGQEVVKVAHILHIGARAVELGEVGVVGRAPRPITVIVAVVIHVNIIAAGQRAKPGMTQRGRAHLAQGHKGVDLARTHIVLPGGVVLGVGLAADLLVVGVALAHPGVLELGRGARAQPQEVALVGHLVAAVVGVGPVGVAVAGGQQARSTVEPLKDEDLRTEAVVDHVALVAGLLVANGEATGQVGRRVKPAGVLCVVHVVLDVFARHVAALVGSAASGLLEARSGEDRVVAHGQT